MSSSRSRRAQIHETRTFGERASDAVSAGMGSWRYVLTQNGIIALWMLLNSLALFVWHWDPYPFILLNLAMSWFAANSTPILQMSQNRQAAKDRARDDLEAAEVEQLFQMQQQQLEILHKLDALLAAERPERADDAGLVGECAQGDSAQGDSEQGDSEQGDERLVDEW